MRDQSGWGRRRLSQFHRAVLRFLRDFQGCGDLDSRHDREAGKNPTQRTRTTRPGTRPRSGKAARPAKKGRGRLKNCSLALTGPFMAPNHGGNWTAKELHSGPFLAYPKMYEFGSPDFAPGSRLQSLSCTNPHWFLGITVTASLFRACPASSIPGPVSGDLITSTASQPECNAMLR
jgi:hypothetical protein